MNTNDELLAKEARYAWLRSQWVWHKRRATGANERWHKQQARFYRKAAGKVFTLSEIIFKTMRQYSAELCENVTKNNVLLKKLMEREAK